ncbi:YhcH/YjgK/YiaL family protein [Clostridium sp. BL-8]|uniref:YhcH/YjgK/YiaL family protein n=1 Tax=Clostridium sp. BL-8 TaxID=349938 RepID=UPI00098BF9B1|nr:YhcH/YjgK/YiaL family protein [Clostridium sp. BL-8]OOM78882.1 toxin-antitoxin biofilm protein TabA [Clostridium sp. BL-8]
MIIADLKDFKHYYKESDKMGRAFKFLQENDLQALETGKHLIEGEDIFALVQVYTTKESGLCRFESHKRYIDIQFIVSGIEKMSYLPIHKLILAEDDLIKSDKALYKNASGNDLIVNEGQFVVFYPEDGHKACIAIDDPCQVKKIVLKVALD